ncbi:MAG: MdtA/MuxA family multidrug efflux RND transporter periplasmic adaptor subunit [Betaproteobacteria bacterium]|nr:MdtA/MuxA family multidrug efflux RND transporter periplasmic adaptor subunit [Betaproteobacteria bacterium]
MSDVLPPPPGARAPRRRIARIVYAVTVLAAAAAAAWWYWGRSADVPATASPGYAAKASAGGPGTAAPGGAPGKGGRFGDPNRVQPVAAVAARKGNVRVIQNALGTVTALRTVTVKPRVDGPLLSLNFVEGRDAKAGDVLAVIDPAPYQVALSQSEGQLARDQALLQNARLDYERYKTLLAQDSIAKQLVDGQEALVRQYEGTVKVDQAQVDNAKLLLSWTRVTAPVSGRLGLRVVDAGNIVRASDANGLVVITQVDPITVLFSIPQDNLPRVLARLATGERLAVEAWDRDQKQKLATGTLLTSDNQVDVTTGTVRMRAQFANADRRLFPNQFVNVRMVVDTREGAIVVPSAAIQRNSQGTIVYVVKDDSTVAVRPVKTGPAEGDLTAIDSGLALGERVITDGVDRLREGAKVEVTAGAGAGVGAGAGGRGPRGEGRPADGSRRESRKAEGAKPAGQ